MAGKLLLALIADIIWRLSIANIPWPGPIDGILRRVPMADIVGLILRSLNEVLESMEKDLGVRRVGGFFRRIHTLKRVIFAAHFRQSYAAEAYQGRGERIRNEHHRSMSRLLLELRESDYRCREALYDPRLRLELVGNRRIRRRNKQRRRRAQRRWIQAKGHLESCIRNLIREAMLYHLICEIEKEQGRSFEFSVVSREIDVRVIEVMITLFPHFLFMVTSCIDIVGRFQHYDVFPEIQDGDGPWKYRLFRTPVAGFYLYLTMLVCMLISNARYLILFIFRTLKDNVRLLILFFFCMFKDNVLLLDLFDLLDLFLFIIIFLLSFFLFSFSFFSFFFFSFLFFYSSDFFSFFFSFLSLFSFVSFFSLFYFSFLSLFFFFSFFSFFSFSCFFFLSSSS